MQILVFSGRVVGVAQDTTGPPPGPMLKAGLLSVSVLHSGSKSMMSGAVPKLVIGVGIMEPTRGEGYRSIFRLIGLIGVGTMKPSRREGHRSIVILIGLIDVGTIGPYSLWSVPVL